jgi:hypothetical protein
MATSSKPPHLLLHTLLGELSYWGTSVRILLIGFVLFVANLVTVLNTVDTVSITSYGAQFIYVMGSLLLLDAGYVTIARALPISTEMVDRVLFLGFMAALGFVVVLPHFAVVPQSIMVSVKWVFIVTLFVLALRLVLGLFFGGRTDRR